jgi:predicted nucleic acid-binding protein
MKCAYFDTSYIVKLYCLEPGASKIQKALEEYEAIASSIHAHGEFVSSLHRKVREKSATREQMKTVLHQFHQDQEAGLILLYPSTPEIFKRIESVYLQAPTETFLRAADAHHLATAAEQGFTSIYSSDTHLLAAAPLFDLQGIDLI